MDQTQSLTSVEQLADGLLTGIERLLRELETSASDETLAATVAELLDVVLAVDDLLETIDFETLPDTVEMSALPALVEFDAFPDAIRERNPDPALDLGRLEDVITLRELWNTIDVVDFQRELRQLKRELEDIVGPNAFESPDDSEAVSDVKNYIEAIKPDATNAVFQQEAKKSAKVARNGLLEAHSEFDDLYESTRRGHGRQPVSNNPTAVTTVPAGPLPAGVSTRVSTVPTNVRQAKVDALRRIYGRRWRTTRPNQ
ncbi:hypothetical protein [Natrinema gelatinilyticum]|uniref:hypothetical protein n=1 Tax=Natrinema gelatinilyticum TaxID=2961571 RepID=UPI0020C5475F|nr:hypothetical protein [Natrinema gelatinilyticum]